MWRRWRRWFAVATTAALVGLRLVSCGAGEDADVSANDGILAGLPVLEGAEEKSHRSSPYFLSDQPGGPDGYTTNVVYTVAEGTTDEEILQFYADSIGGEWDHCREEVPVIQPGAPVGPNPTPIGRVLHETFFRDGVSVSVMAEGLSPTTYSGTFEVSIDHNAYQNFCTGEDLR